MSENPYQSALDVPLVSSVSTDSPVSTASGKESNSIPFTLPDGHTVLIFRHFLNLDFDW